MEEQEEKPLTYHECAVEALRLVTKLNSLGVYASLKMDDVCLRLHVPRHVGNADYDSDESVGIKCEPWELDSFLGTARLALDLVIQHRTKESRVAETLALMPIDTLKELDAADDLAAAVKVAIRRAT